MTDSGEDTGERTSRKRAAILAAATEAFLERGYGQVAMDAIARVAGVSKQTVYNHFPNKETLFVATIGRECQRFVEPFLAAQASHDNPRDVLSAIARAIMDKMLDPKAIGLYRVLVLEAPRFPDLGRKFFEVGPRQAIAVLAAYLEKETQAGRLSIADGQMAAEHFFGLLTSQIQMRGLLGLQQPDADQITYRIRVAIEAFLRAYGGGSQALAADD